MARGDGENADLSAAVGRRRRRRRRRGRECRFRSLRAENSDLSAGVAGGDGENVDLSAGVAGGQGENADLSAGVCRRRRRECRFKRLSG